PLPALRSVAGPGGRARGGGRAHGGAGHRHGRNVLGADGLPWVRRGRTKSRMSAADAAGRAARTGPGPAVLAAAPLALPRPRLPGRDIRRASPDPGAIT